MNSRNWTWIWYHTLAWTDCRELGAEVNNVYILCKLEKENTVHIVLS